MKRHIPNTLTSFNLVSGTIAAYFAATGNLKLALIFMVIGLIFDFFDGFTARLLGVSSPIGKELDSLADVVTFGVTPALMVFYALQNFPLFEDQLPLELLLIMPCIAFAIAAFSAIRLAKFNLDTRQSHSFIGLPTPANALFWAGLTTFLDETYFPSIPNTIMGITLLLLIAFSCWIMVSEVPMFALKFKNFSLRNNKVRFGFIALSAIIVVFGIALQVYPIALSLVIVLYVLISLFVREKEAE